MWKKIYDRSVTICSASIFFCSCCFFYYKAQYYHYLPYWRSEFIKSWFPKEEDLQVIIRSTTIPVKKRIIDEKSQYIEDYSNNISKPQLEKLPQEALDSFDSDLAQDFTAFKEGVILWRRCWPNENVMMCWICFGILRYWRSPIGFFFDKQPHQDLKVEIIIILREL